MQPIIIDPTPILHGYLRLTPLQNKPPSFPSEMVFRRYYGNRRFGGGGNNAAYWRGRRAAAAAARRRKRFSPFTRYGRALQVGRAATRQALAHFKQVDRAAWPEYRKQKFDMSALTGVGDYAFSKKVTPSIGARVGAWAGDALGGWLGRITGLGDYEATAVDPMPSINPPVVRNASDRSVVISHREYIGDVVTSPNPGAFNLMSFMVNPGNEVVFPWLSRVAACFQEYTLNGCLFQFKSMSADALNSTNTALGQVICATNYNVSQQNYQSKFEMENTEFGSSCKPSESFMHPIECDRRMNVLGNMYVAASGVVPPGSDPQFYNHCNFQIATNGFQGASVNVGELWVTYEVILRKPIQPEAQGVAGDLNMVQTGSFPVPPVTGGVIQPGWFLAPGNTIFEYPADAVDPTSMSGKNYVAQFAGTNLNIVSTNNPGADSTLVGRVFTIMLQLFNNTAGTFTGTSVTGITVGANMNTSLFQNPAATHANSILTNPNGTFWQLTCTFVVTGPGPLTLQINGTPVIAQNLTSTARTLFSLTELPALMFGRT